MFFGRKTYRRAFAPPFATPPPKYTDANTDIKADSPLFLFHPKM